MKRNAVSIIAVMLIASVAMISCSQPGANPDNANARDLVMVSFTKPEAKAATVTPGTVNTPELGSLYFQYKAVKNAADTSGVTIGAKTEWTNLGSSAGLAQTIELSRGKWDISLRGFASSTNRSSGTNPIFEGNVTYDVGADLATKGETVNVELNFTNPSGTGSYEIAVTVPDSYANSAAQVKVTVTPSSGSAKTLTKSYSSSVKTQTFAFSGLANGTASVKVEYMDRNGVALGNAVTENMLIMTDMTTRGTSSVTETNTYTISFAGAVSGTAEDIQPVDVIAKPNVNLYYPGGGYSIRLFEPQEGVTYYYTYSLTDYAAEVGTIPPEPATPTTESNVVNLSLSPGFIQGFDDIGMGDRGIYFKVVGYRNGKYSDVTEYIRADKGRWGTAEEEGARTPI